MNRAKFIKHFKEKYQDNYFDDYKVLFFNADLSSFDNNKLLSTIYINSILKEDFEILGINTNINLDKKFINVEFDYDFNEDESNVTPLIRHNIHLNLNSIFDYIVETQPELNNNKINIYRIEHKDGGSLYDGIGFHIMSENIKDNEQPSPREEKEFMSIFEFQNRYINNDYKKSWQFAFSSLPQLERWINSSDKNLKLKDAGYIICKLEIQDNFVINGEHQTIFKKDTFLNKSVLNFKNNIKIKNI